MPPSTRRTPTDKPAGSEPPVEPRSAASTGRLEPAGDEYASRAEDDRTTMKLRLPFMTLSVTRPRTDPARGAGAQAQRGRPGTAGPQVAGSGSGERLLFYTGVAALGAAGVIEWPVAAAIAVGTYIAGKARAAPPVAGGSGTTRSTGAAPTDATGAAPVQASPPPDG
ncbi:MAG: hypothetical protein JWP46_3687 [Modestobacter sp.]|jgi:hypothetical protein|nr:hypothetical protein [Modestobacter sp.]